VRRQLTATYTSQQNGVVERCNAIVVGAARSILKARGMPNQFFLGGGVLTAVYVLNRTPTKSVEGAEPFELWYGKKPYVHLLRTFGYIGYIKNTKPNLPKLEDRGQRMVFVGYETSTKGYMMFDPVTNKVHVSRDIVFEESAQWDWSGDNTEDAADSGTLLLSTCW
jgi:hypothetical protein